VGPAVASSVPRFKSHKYTIYNCLRAYAAIDNTAGAEEIFRTTTVSLLVQKIIPYSTSEADGSTSDELEEDYQQIMKFIDMDCKFLLDISSSANSGLHVFDFLANSILKEILLAIQRGKPGALSPGKPNQFLNNYKSSMDFLAYLEGYCPSKSAVVKFRSEAIHADFMKIWNVGVYFSLRFQEIAGALDSALTSSNITIIQNLDKSQGNCHGLTLKQSTTLLDSLRSCWKEDVLVFSYADKFLRLCRQLLSRYSTWLSSGLAARKASNIGTVPPPGYEWAINVSADDLVYVVHDVDFLITELANDYPSSNLVTEIGVDLNDPFRLARFQVVQRVL